MLKLIILEGPRGTGKSTITRKLRDKVDGATLINLTGFKTDGEEGLAKIKSYYNSLDTYLHHLSKSQHTYTVIFDRTFFSEVVYSKIYKSYDFTASYNYLLNSLFDCVDELHLFYLRLNDGDKLRERLNRDKVQLFDKVEESVAESFKQQEYYDALFSDMASVMLNVNSDTSKIRTFKTIQTDSLSIEDVYDIIMEGISCQTAGEK